jgi:aminopeptidase N
LATLEGIAQQQLEHAERASNFQKVAFDAYAALVYTSTGLEAARNYLLGKNLPQEFILDQDRRWVLLRKLNQFQYKDYLELTSAEQQKDKSDLGQQMAIVCEVIRPDNTIKEKWLSELLAANTQYKYATQRLVMKAIFPVTQLTMRSGFDARIVQNLPQVQARNNDRFLSVYADLVSPHACSSASVQRVVDIRNQYANLSPALGKTLNANIQEEQRCVDMMQLMTKK